MTINKGNKDEISNIKDEMQVLKEGKDKTEKEQAKEISDLKSAISTL